MVREDEAGSKVKLVGNSYKDVESSALSASAAAVQLKTENGCGCQDR